MKPLGHKVLVLPTKEDKSSGGLIIPTSGQKNNKGKIIFVGTKVSEDWVGKTAIFYEHAGTEIEYEGQKHLMLKCGEADTEVIAVH